MIIVFTIVMSDLILISKIFIRETREDLNLLLTVTVYHTLSKYFIPNMCIQHLSYDII